MSTRPDEVERTELCEALIELCFERGYRQTSIALVVERAALDEAAFHRHFDDLEDCFCQVYAEIRDWANARVARAIVSEQSWRGRMRAAAYALLSAFNQDQRNTHLAMVEVRFAGDRALLLVAEGMEEMFALIDEGRDDPEASERISRTTAESIGGSIFNQVFVALNREFPLAAEVVPQLMYAAVLPYLGPDVAAEELGIPAPPYLPDDEPPFHPGEV